ncbi:MAG: hypothetical protein MJZ74_03080 [Muribaculaceae bacterium]|nr:hypothetical protein [Muribaculaceae bacterium]
MKKILFPILGLFFVLCSCDGVQNSTTAPINDTLHIEQYFHKFRARFPDGFDNDVKKEKMNEQFAKEIVDSLNNSNWLLEDLPIRCEGIKSWKPGTCRIHFQSWIKPYNLYFKDNVLNDVCFDIVAEVPESFVDKVKDKQYYLINGRFKRFILHSEFEQYSNGMAYTNQIGLSKEYTDEYNINLGEMLFEIDSIKPYK